MKGIGRVKSELLYSEAKHLTRRYEVRPTLLSLAPARVFYTRKKAFQHAQEAASKYRIGFSVFKTWPGGERLLNTFRPADRRA